MLLKSHLTKVFITTGFCLLLSLGAQATPSKPNLAFPSLAPTLKKAMPAIVNISIQGELPPTIDTPQSGRGQAALSKKPRKFKSIGSGVILDPRRGFIITNAHVVKDAKFITVTLHDGRRIKANLVGSDPVSDIAILHIKAPDLASLPLSDSSQLKVGDFVVAIGNPFGLNTLGTSQSATFGIVSALQRSDLNIEGMESFIQTDAAINPGNSGGALIDMNGNLVGINTAILSPFGVGNVGIGFAIPINMAQKVAEQLIKYGSVHRGMMGVYVQHLTPELANAFGSPGAEGGALITQVNKDSPAAKAGLRSGDIIQSINGTKITQASEVKNIVGLLRVGSKVELDIIRHGKLIHLKSTVADVRKNEEKQLAEHPFLFGLALRNFDQESPIHGHVTGVQIIGASENSPAWRAGLRPGDVIIDANHQNITSVQELQKIATEHPKQLLVHLLRNSGALYLLVS